MIADMTLGDIDDLKAFLEKNTCGDICMEKVYEELDCLRAKICDLKTKVNALGTDCAECPLPGLPCPSTVLGRDGYDDAYGVSDRKLK